MSVAHCYSEKDGLMLGPNSMKENTHAVTGEALRLLLDRKALGKVVVTP